MVSSAKEIILNNFVDSGKSLMYNRNNKVPKMNLCGTSVVIRSELLIYVSYAKKATFI